MQSRYLWFLTLTYSMVIILANWFDLRLIHIFGLDTDSGTLIYPFTFLLSDLITEVYGYKHARRAIWCGLFFNFIFVAYGQLVVHMPSPNYQTNNAMFDAILTVNVRLFIASAISYLVSENLNSFIMAKLKIKMKGNHMGFRFILSTFISSAADSALFGSLAFYNTIHSINLLHLIITMWLTKAVIEIVFLPFSTSLAKKLKSIERLDIYDNKTDFNVFSLDADYTTKDNKYRL